MCGIVGIHSPTTVPDTDVLLRMMAALDHRGPDGNGYYRDETVALGHMRLAIIDPGLGVQPMCGEREEVWVTFNGEIFNYVELRAQLRDRGHHFRTHSDTEVIVHAWEEWGPGCFERFNGQWALAIWDRRRDELVLSRDRVGVRPLYVTTAGGRVLFASEVKALFADPQVARAFDPVGMDQVLTFWSTVAPRTVFAGIEQVVPGTYVVIRDGVVKESHAYWQPSFPERGGGSPDLDGNAAGLRERLIEATRLRFERSDVPVGAYLSGGIDSAVTAGIIRDFTDAELHTFSLRFADAEYDEGDHQALMTRRLGTTHRDIVVSHADIGAVFPDVVRHAETPLLRTAPAPMFLLSRLVRESGYKVVVTGEGSDEVLAGYDIFREARVREFWAREPESPKRARAIELLYPWLGRNPNQAPAFARSFFARNLDPGDLALSHRPRWDTTAALKAMLVAAEPDTGLPDASSDLLARMPDEAAGWDGLSRAQWLEMTTLLPGYILASQGDRMLMANSIEGRFPFLDAEVLAFAGRLPARHKILGLDEKHLLKRAFRDMLPPEIVARPKQPYRAPDAAGFVGADAPAWVAEVTSREAVEAAGVFKPGVVESLLAKAGRSRGRALSNTDSMRLAAVLSVQLLHEQFMDPGGPGSRARPSQPTTVFDEVDPQRRAAWRQPSDPMSSASTRRPRSPESAR